MLQLHIAVCKYYCHEHDDLSLSQHWNCGVTSWLWCCSIYTI